MSEEKGITLITPHVASRNAYDVVVVGSGVAGATVAKHLSEEGKTVLILEAGTSEGLTPEGFRSYLETFYTAVSKNANAPYPLNPNALSPTDGVEGYFEEMGPLPISGSYTRVVGGTTMHWEGKTLRMLPEDFELRTRYAQGLDWPLGYQQLEPYYRKAEYEIGVAGDVDEERLLGIPFPDNYVFPMKRVPPSYLDEQIRKKIDGLRVDIGGRPAQLKLSTFPQARNTEPNPEYAAAGVASPRSYGVPCQGSASCVPICPFGAKYDARRTLNEIRFPERVHLLPQAVAFDIQIDTQTGRVVGIRYKHYERTDSSTHTVGTVKGRLFVLAANAIENARLMLSSNLTTSSRLVGRNLMDHPFILAWGLMPEVAGTMRGPLVTSGIGTFRSGTLRSTQAAFGVDIHNDGWGWSGTSASDVLRDMVDNKRKYGADLRKELVAQISRQLLLAFMCELPADSSNRVTVDPRHTDKLGNYRPVIHFDIPEYCKKTMVYARDLSRQIFTRLGAQDHTHYAKSDPAYFEYEGEDYWFRGGNHFSGTHIMGTHNRNSVVDVTSRCWDHPNLYLVGGGSMPSIGSANITLSIVALSIIASEQMIKDLNSLFS